MQPFDIITVKWKKQFKWEHNFLSKIEMQLPSDRQNEWHNHREQAREKLKSCFPLAFMQMAEPVHYLTLQDRE